MPALSYKARFVDLVASGAKPHSIRAWRKRPFKVGDTLMHYTAMRTKVCRKIRPDTACTAAVSVFIDATTRSVVLDSGSRFYRDGRLDRASIKLLAQRDGFSSVAEFFAFFDRGFNLVFSGQLIEWKPNTFAPAPVPAPENGEPAAARKLAPLSPVSSRPAAAGQREPRGQRLSAPAAAANPRAAKKPGRNFLRGFTGTLFIDEINP